MKKTFGLTYDLKTDWIAQADDPVDASAELDSPATMERIKLALERAGHTVKKIGNVRNLLKQTQNKELDVDIVFNICEGYRGRNRESEVPVILEMNRIPFVGSDALTMGVSLDKVVAKKVFISEGIRTPRYFTAYSTENLAKLNTIGYPLIVKTRHEGTSKGLTPSSRVENLESLKKQVDLINKKYKQSALVEEFIRGTEFTVAVLGNRNPVAMPVVQISIDGKSNLGDEFFTFDRVIVKEETVKYLCPAPISEKLTKEMQEMAVKAYQSIDCRDFGRVDFRVDEKGKPYVLEINPLPSLAEKDVFNIFPQAIGSNYDETIKKIIGFALERYQLADDKKVSAKDRVQTTEKRSFAKVR
jgi:D-alanine-D-alanine ligase